MFNSLCCKYPPKTGVSDDLRGFCLNCGQYTEFERYGEEKDDYATIESEYKLFRDKVRIALDFYGNPQNYIVNSQSDSSTINMDEGQNARELLAAMEVSDEGNID